MSQTNRSDKAEVDLAGKTLGDFRLIRRLGRGGMAEVWLAQQRSLDRSVALKLLRADLAADDVYIQRFRVEAQAAARLIHGNIIQIYDVGQVDGMHFIAQEYVEGRNLRELMVQTGPPDLKLAVSILRQTASALQKAADQGIVHRDIKPENIMLARSGEVKVADFGLARVVGEGSLNLTQVGMTMGTPLYMSPEQVQGKELDSRSDIYSFGVTCYHMLAGAPPFRGETALAVALQHLQARPPALENARPDLPPAFSRLVHKMLAKDPAHRHQHPREILQELRGIAAAEQIDGEGWSEVPLPPLEATAAHRATQRLAEVMRTQTQMQAALPARSRGRFPAWALWAAAVAAGVLLGGAVGAASRRPPLALPTRGGPQIPRQESAAAQYFLASQLNSEEGWKSVFLYFPQEEYYGRRAKQQLARFYLYSRDYEAAGKLFDELANLPDGEAEFRAIGLAGKCIVLSFQGDYSASAELLIRVWPMQRHLDPSLRELLQDVLQTNRKRANQREQEKLRELREDEGTVG